MMLNSVIFSLGNGFPNEQSMVKYLMGDNATVVLAGVVFDTRSMFNDSTLSTDLSYKLRFPARLRTASEEWRTETMYPAFSLPGPRDANEPTGGIPSMLVCNVTMNKISFEPIIQKLS